eukprot:scaffold36625_cov59-Phaeocystis_antarctica.AAC.3
MPSRPIAPPVGTCCPERLPEEVPSSSHMARSSGQLRRRSSKDSVGKAAPRAPTTPDAAFRIHSGLASLHLATCQPARRGCRGGRAAPRLAPSARKGQAAQCTKGP